MLHAHNTHAHRADRKTKYEVFLWALPTILTIDLDVDVQTQIQQSEWLQANVMLDVLPKVAVTYCPGPRRLVRMCDMPRFKPTQ